jgi:deoxyadenosine/deoxycytidine kinase
VDRTFPKFIVIEGPLRVGKSTLARILAERLHARRVYDCEDNPFLGGFLQGSSGFGASRANVFSFRAAKRLREA